MKQNEIMNGIKKGMDKEYKQFVDKNQDDYGNAAIVAAATVGNALSEGKSCKEASGLMYGMNLTLYMAGCVAGAIYHFHERGEEFKIWWNEDKGITDKAVKGPVNPALVTVTL